MNGQSNRRTSGSANSELADRVHALLLENDPLMPRLAASARTAAVVAELTGMGPLDPLLNDPEISEVMVNGPGEVWIEKFGHLIRVDCDIDRATINRCIDRIIGPLGLRIDRMTPYVDARLPDGSRCNAVIEPLAIDGPYLTIRRFRDEPFSIADFTDTVTARALIELVEDRKSMIISGPTGSGKTSLLSALSHCIGEHERVISIEDTAELRLRALHVIRLEARRANVEGQGAVTVRDLVRNALRMRPDRLVIGEVRGAEALDMITALQTGHAGSLATVHANTADDALARLEVLILMAGLGLPLDAVRRQISRAVDIIVQVRRDPSGQRVISDIAEVTGDDRPSARSLGLPCEWPEPLPGIFGEHGFENADDDDLSDLDDLDDLDDFGKANHAN
jgi:pilus assembly protein CpaF